MKVPPLTITVQPTTLGFVDRVVTLASWAVGGALFLTVGWNAMAPQDPLGAVSTLSRPNGAIMILQAAGLAGVCAALATILAGRKLVDVGTFAVALGLALVSLRGSTASSVLQQSLYDSERALAGRFAVEASCWFGVIGVALLTSAVIMRWIHADRRGDGREPRGGGSRLVDSSGVSAGFDIPGLSAVFLGEPGHHCTIVSDGLKHAVTLAGVGLLTVSAISVGLTSRSIQHGQVCFVIFAAVFFATYVAHRVVPVRSAFWSIVAVGLMCIVGYLWAAVRPAVPSLPPYVPASHFLRILPIQFIAVGTAATLAATWYTVFPETAVMQTNRVSSSSGGKTAKSG